MGFRRSLFGGDFVWGVSSAAAQIEGAWNVDGRGESIWDRFSSNKKNIYKGHNPKVACDFYHRYDEDLQLLRHLNIPHYRFSLAWPRIFPQGIGKPNQIGVDFYHRVIDQCLALGITPWVTLYHWDLPQALENKGGWINREILNWFEYFVDFCTREYGDKVKHWMVLNEPMVFVGAGYFLGLHAPGRKGLSNFLPAIHHATLSQAIGGNVVRNNVRDVEVGTTFSCSHIQPHKGNGKDLMAARRVDALLNRMFIEPSLGMGYPMEDLKPLKNIIKYFKDGDEGLMQFNFDFIGVQNYTREVVTHSYFTPLIYAKLIGANKRGVLTTDMNWEVYPQAIYEMLKKIGAYKRVKKVIVTENGAAFPDKLEDGEIKDYARIHYLSDHMTQFLRAKNEGVNVAGYFIWTFTDNFEWAEGYKPRFGIVYTDYKTQERVIKESGYWFKKFLIQPQTDSVLSNPSELVNFNDFTER